MRGKRSLIGVLVRPALGDVRVLGEHESPLSLRSEWHLSRHECEGGFVRGLRRSAIRGADAEVPTHRTSFKQQRRVGDNRSRLEGGVPRRVVERNINEGG